MASTVYHVDLASPIERSYHGSEYFMVAVYQDYVNIYGLKTKDEAGERTAEFLAYVQRQSRAPIRDFKVVRTDGGGKLKTTDFRQLVAEQGLQHQHSVRYRSSQNGVAERAIRTVTEMACAMLLDSQLPHYLWEDALTHATYVRNRLSRKGSATTPHEKLFGEKPPLRQLPVFGQSVVIRVPDQLRRKRFRFDGRGDLGAFVGFSEAIKGYRVHVPGNVQRIRESTGVLALYRMLYDQVVLPSDIAPPPAEGGGEDEQGLEDVEVNEGFERPAAPTSTIARRPREMEDVQREMRTTCWTRAEVEEANGSSELTANRRSERQSAKTSEQDSRAADVTPPPINAAYLLLTEIIREPLNLAEARRTPQWHEWEAATWTDIQALEVNHTYDPVHLPTGMRDLDNTVQLRLKLDADGSIDKYKVRVCAREDHQEYLIDYVETHVPAMDLVCVNIFLVIVAKYRMTMRQGNVPAAYLKAKLKETVYVKQVRGFENPGQEDKVWRLKKALYGLNQAGREWNKGIDRFLRTYGLRPTAKRHCSHRRGGCLRCVDQDAEEPDGDEAAVRDI